LIHVIAAIKTRPGQLGALTRAFQKILPQVQAKPGCQEYSLAWHTPTGLPGQADYDEEVLTIVEKWDDLAALRRHIDDPAYLDWLESQWEMVEQASMQVLQAV
jgi:quinol monooxygenase YgiN